jgi:hypothetical protein
MNPKEYLSESSGNLLEKLNSYLTEIGIADQEHPFYIKKIQLGLGGQAASGFAPTRMNNVERKCVEWDSKLVERTHPVTKEKYWELVQWCKRYEDEG